MAGFERLDGRAAREAAQQFFDTPNHETFEAYARLCFPLYNRTPQDPDAFPRVCFNLELALFFYATEFKTMNFLPALTQVQCPTLVLAGEDDPIKPLADAEEMGSVLPANLVRFERFPGAGHGVFRDDPVQGFQRSRKFILEGKLNPQQE